MATAATHGKPDQGDALKAWARAGYAARGIVYLLVGGLAALAVFGPGGQTTDSRGALQALLRAPAGDIMLGAIAVGLVGYAIWRAIQAIKDTDHHGAGAKGVAIRGGLAVSAVMHILLAFFTISLIFTIGGGGSGSSGGGSEGLASWLMKQPYGPWLVGLVGVAVIGAGISHTIKAWKVEFDKHLRMPPQKQRWAYPVCRFGLAIRGVVLIIIGGFFTIAAYQADPSEAAGLAQVFNAIREQTFGTILLAIVAIGLFAFGIYSLIEAVYRRVNPGD